MPNNLFSYKFQVRVMDASDNCVAAYDDLTSCYYKKQVNAPGMAIFTAPEDHDILNYAIDDTLMEVWISYYDPYFGTTSVKWAQRWAQDFVGLFRDRQIATDSDGNVYHLLYVPGLTEVLGRYVSGYPTGVNDKSSWVGQNLGIICNDLVRWNCTSDATTANGRIRNSTIVRGLHDAGAIGGTPVVNYSVPPGRNVLEFMQELAPICGFDFEVRKRSGFPGTVEYKQFAGQLGTDRSASVFFDLALDNVAVANLDFDGLREKTVAIVGGPGEESARIFSVRTGVNYASTNDYEMFVDARDHEASELSDVGDARLGDVQARLQMRNTIQLSKGWVYRRDFNHGDLVTVQFAGASEVKKIAVTEVKFDQDQRCEIRMEFVEP